MIVYWLSIFFKYLVFLVVPVDAKMIAQIDVNASCPICGAQRGRLRCVRRAVKGERGAAGTLVVLCQHTCRVCGARFYEKPVVDVRPEQIRGAIARDDHEHGEDTEFKIESTPGFEEQRLLGVR